MGSALEKEVGTMEVIWVGGELRMQWGSKSPAFLEHAKCQEKLGVRDEIGAQRLSEGRVKMDGHESSGQAGTSGSVKVQDSSGWVMGTVCAQRKGPRKDCGVCEQVNG